MLLAGPGAELKGKLTEKMRFRPTAMTQPLRSNVDNEYGNMYTQSLSGNMYTQSLSYVALAKSLSDTSQAPSPPTHTVSYTGSGENPVHRQES